MAQLELFLHPLALLTVQYTKTGIFDQILKLNLFYIDYRVPNLYEIRLSKKHPDTWLSQTGRYSSE